MSATQPYFSILVPTRNRSEILLDSINSVLRQSFEDYEIVISDNSDDNATHEVLKQIDDPRIRYYKVQDLSMDQNWEYLVGKARGQYITFVTDKRALRRRALEHLAWVIEQTQAPVISWHMDTIDDQNPSALFFKKQVSAWQPEKIREIASVDLARQFVSTLYEKTLMILPRGLNSCVRADVVEIIRQSPAGALCLPYTPDYTMAFLQLAFVDTIVHLPYPLGLSRIAAGTGKTVVMRKNQSAIKRFFGEAGGMDKSYRLMPIKSSDVQNLLYNDYMEMRALVGGNLSEIEIPMREYFINFYHSCALFAMLGADYREDFRAWAELLARQPASLQADVRKGIRKIQLTKALPTLGYRIPLMHIYPLFSKLLKRSASPRFANTIEALEWEEQQVELWPDRPSS